MKKTVTELTLDRLLGEISRRHLCLLADGRLWAPNTHVSRDIRRAIREHQAELAELIRVSDWRVCSSPANHWPYWTDEQCEACAHLQIALQTLDKRRRRRKSANQVEHLASA